MIAAVSTLSSWYNEIKDQSSEVSTDAQKPGYTGTSNVVVLVDDVEDSGDSNRRRILEEQRLDSYATELILISEQEKESASLMGPDPIFSESPISVQLHDAYSSLYHKLLKLKDIINNAPYRNTGRVPSVMTSTSGFRSPGKALMIQPEGAV
ncbi:unnamed protein product [Ranitomeya imitator]|uniref:Uncharacterized protein n=1 Tax=Ranitomeya imitator TaxID=111125 RepID=A0ABN9L9B8_9NEOB|nr:unnamed protein product [Ranitomeya imitator]